LSSGGAHIRSGERATHTPSNWQHQPDRHCTLCGRLLIRAYLAVLAEPFCDEECAEIYRTYWLPRNPQTPARG